MHAVVFDDSLDLPSLHQAGKWITLAADLSAGRPHDVEYTNELLARLLDRRFTEPAGAEVFRARLMPLERELDAEPLGKEEMGPPPVDKAVAGRLNRSGVPRLYGALDSDTAIAECRPWRMARISVATFRTTTSLTLVDLTGRRSGQAPTPQDTWLSFILGRPVHRDDLESYMPSQWLAAASQSRGVDGILYNSSLNPEGTNVALFVHEHLTCEAVTLCEISSIQCSAQQLSVSNDA